MRKRRVFALLAGTFVFASLGILTQANGKVNPDCPNGCLDKIGSCPCYEDHAYKEASGGTL